MKGALLKSTDMENVGCETEYYVNEAYESMSIPKQIAIILLAFVSYALCAIVFYILPEKEVYQSRQFVLNPNSTDLALQFHYEERKNYQPYVHLRLGHRESQGVSSIMAVTFQADIYRGNTLFSTLEEPKKQISISPGGFYNLFSFTDIDASKIEVRAVLNLVTGSLNNVFAQWVHFNSTFAFYVIFVFFTMAIALFYIIFILFKAIYSLKKRIPTVASKYLLFMFFLSIFAIVPIPELIFFDILYWMRSFSWIFTVLSYSIFFVLGETMTWNLKHREFEEESFLYRRSYAMLFFLLFLFGLPHLAQWGESMLYDFLTFEIPLSIIAMLLLNVIRVPFLLGVDTEEFWGSLLHIFIIIPGYICIFMCIFTKTQRFDTLEVYTRMILPLISMFLAFIRWPYEEESISKFETLNDEEKEAFVVDENSEQ